MVREIFSSVSEIHKERLSKAGMYLKVAERNILFFCCNEQRTEDPNLAFLKAIRTTSE